MQTQTRRQARRGFTLMELLLVMAILVILLSLVSTRFIGTQKKTNINATRVQVGLFKNALDNYAVDMNTYPSTEQGLLALAEEPADLEDPKKWGGPYLETIPKDVWGHEFQYEYPSTKTKRDFPDIWSLGPDGEEGTEDDIGNWTEEDTEGEK